MFSRGGVDYRHSQMLLEQRWKKSTSRAQSNRRHVSSREAGARCGTMMVMYRINCHGVTPVAPYLASDYVKVGCKCRQPLREWSVRWKRVRTKMLMISSNNFA
jgi:hypothetical protein